MSTLDGFESEMTSVNIIRNGKLLVITKGLKNTTKSNARRTFNFYPDTDIDVGDIIELSGTNFKYYVEEVEPKYWHGELDYIDAYYITLDEYAKKNKQPDSQTVYNIGKASNSIIGNQQNAAINIGMTVDEFRKAIEANGEGEKEALNKIADMLQTVIDDNTPVSKGSFSKFSDLIAKHSWVATCLTQILLKWLIK